MKEVVLTSDLPEFARAPVDNGQTSLFEGREFRTIRGISLGAGKEVVWKFECDVDFMLFEQSVSISGGNYDFYVWRDDNVTELLPITIPVKIIGKNGSNEYRKYNGVRYVRKATILKSANNNIDTTLTIADVEDYYDIEMIKSPTSTANRVNVGGSDNSVRYLPAGVYYLHHKNPGNSEIQLIYSISWEERPPYLQKTN